MDKKRKNFIYGKKIYASNNVLKENICCKIDDIISLFYILVKFKLGTLPWIEYTDETIIIDMNKILKIREEYPPKILCKDFPYKNLRI